MPSNVKLDDKKLKDLIKGFKNVPKARVGVMSSKNTRSEGELNNVKLGAIHEFGLGNQPVRSFLRMPITTQLKPYLEQRGTFNKEALQRVVSEKDLSAWMEKVGAVALETVLEAFATNGFEQWKRSNMQNKKVHQTLVETGKLRESIDYEVIK